MRLLSFRIYLVIFLLFSILLLSIRFVNSQTTADYKFELENLNIRFRKELTAIIQEAERSFGVKVNTSNMICKVVRFRAASELSDSIKSMIIINTPTDEAENITYDKLNRGINLFFTFFQIPEGSEINSGFYKIFVARDPKGRDQYIAQFKDINGKVILQKPITVREVDTKAKGVQVQVSFKIIPGKPPTIEIDIIIKPKEPPTQTRAIYLNTSFRIGDREVQALPSSEPYKKILEVTNKYIKGVDNIFLQISKLCKLSIIQSWDSMSISDKIFTVYTVFENVNKLSINDFTEEQDFFFGYLPTLEDQNIPAGFYNIALYKESGGFYAQLKEKGVISEEELKKKLTLKPLADRIIIEPISSEVKSGFYGGIYFNEKLGRVVLEIGYIWNDTKIKAMTNKGSFIISPKMDCG
ncbi:MAG: hypothetical protein RMJ67_08510 [Elusimicrobiota bacterium]|nr:hypothetical protein [Endomicrobiia bacterium]MDW8166537.1 hypothetical protein [Elusimicrobiota bacterium]